MLETSKGDACFFFFFLMIPSIPRDIVDVCLTVFGWVGSFKLTERE